MAGLPNLQLLFERPISIATSSPFNYCSSPENLLNQNRLIESSYSTAAYLKVLPLIEASPQIPFAFAHELIFKSHAFFCCRYFFFSFRNLFLIRNPSVRQSVYEMRRFFTFCLASLLDFLKLLQLHSFITTTAAAKAVGTFLFHLNKFSLMSAYLVRARFRRSSNKMHKFFPPISINVRRCVITHKARLFSGFGMFWNRVHFRWNLHFWEVKCVAPFDCVFIYMFMKCDSLTRAVMTSSGRGYVVVEVAYFVT